AEPVALPDRLPGALAAHRPAGGADVGGGRHCLPFGRDRDARVAAPATGGGSGPRDRGAGRIPLPARALPSDPRLTPRSRALARPAVALLAALRVPAGHVRRGPAVDRPGDRGPPRRLGQARTPRQRARRGGVRSLPGPARTA